MKNLNLLRLTPFSLPEIFSFAAPSHTLGLGACAGAIGPFSISKDLHNLVEKDNLYNFETDKTNANPTHGAAFEDYSIGTTRKFWNYIIDNIK